MKVKLTTTLLSVIIGNTAIATELWYPGSMVGLRTDGTVGFVLDGNPPSDDDLDNNGVLDDGASVILNDGLNVDSEALGAAAGIDLSGNNFDWYINFRIYDSDGIFSFTENFDDSVRFNVSPIVSNIDDTSRGAAGPTFSDTSWNSRTYANYDFSAGPGGGWFDVTIELDENTGGAQSAGGLGIGFYNGSSTSLGDFGGIGYDAAPEGPAVIDSDANGNSFGASITIPEPSVPMLGIFGFCFLILRRR